MMFLSFLAMPIGACIGFRLQILPSREIPRIVFDRPTRHGTHGSYGIRSDGLSVGLGLSGNPVRSGNTNTHTHHNDHCNDYDNGDNNNNSNGIITAVVSIPASGIMTRRNALVLSGATAAATTAATTAPTRTGASTIPVPTSLSRQEEIFHHVDDADADADAANPKTSDTESYINRNRNHNHNSLLESASLYRVETRSTTIATHMPMPMPNGKPGKGPSVKSVTKEDLLANLRTKRAIFLGEHHPEGRDHLLQAALVRSLDEAIRNHDSGIGSGSDSGSDSVTATLAVGLEAVQRQFQPVLDRYSAGVIDEEELQRATEWESRWYWSFEAYRPIFRTCKELGISLLALDIATEDRLLVEAGGLNALDPGKLAEYVPDPVGFEAFGSTAAYRAFVSYTLKPPYELQQRSPLAKGTKKNPTTSFSNFVARQMLRDEGMASAASGWLSQNPHGILVGCIGINHATFGCGVPGRVERMMSSRQDSTRTRGKKNGNDHSPPVASVLINPEPLNTGTELKICQTEGRPPIDDDNDDGDDDVGNTRRRIFVPNTRNQVCIENSVELQNYALQLEYDDDSSSNNLQRPQPSSTINEAVVAPQARRGETVLGLSDYLVFSPKETTI